MPAFEMPSFARSEHDYCPSCGYPRMEPPGGEDPDIDCDILHQDAEFLWAEFSAAVFRTDADGSEQVDSVALADYLVLKRKEALGIMTGDLVAFIPLDAWRGAANRDIEPFKTATCRPADDGMVNVEAGAVVAFIRAEQSGVLGPIAVAHSNGF
jgi:hypothetical protein